VKKLILLTVIVGVSLGATLSFALTISNVGGDIVRMNDKVYFIFRYTVSTGNDNTVQFGLLMTGYEFMWADGSTKERPGEPSHVCSPSVPGTYDVEFSMVATAIKKGHREMPTKVKLGIKVWVIGQEDRFQTYNGTVNLRNKL
jgi:hypothetical protein